MSNSICEKLFHDTILNSQTLPVGVLLYLIKFCLQNSNKISVIDLTFLQNNVFKIIHCHEIYKVDELISKQTFLMQHCSI